MYGREKLRVGELLVNAGYLTNEQVEEVLEFKKEMGGQFGEVAVAKGMVTEDALLEVLGGHLEIPVVNFAELIIDPEVPKLLPARIATRHQILPIEKTDDYILCVVGDPLNIQGIDEAAIMLQKDIQLAIAKRADLVRMLDEYYGGLESMEGLLDDITEDDMELVKDESDFSGGKSAEEDNKIIKYVNLIILEAIKNRASDIHLEPFENEFVIRQRIDGVLHRMPAPPKAVQSSVTSRIKVMAELNIAENRLPQDGRIKLRLGGKEVDLRVSTLPTVFGESVVLRLLDRSAQILGMTELGFQESVRSKCEAILSNPNGIVLVTGPTGSGKTSTLYAFVGKLESTEHKFITVEDPVEYEVEGIVQCQVREKVGMTFAAALRSILRQDPDIVLLGEIRDVETAEISIQASLTGHLVLSTLHTNEAAGAITRLIDMGMEPFLLTSTILGVIGQRLVRRICPMCKEVAKVPEALVKMVAPPGSDTGKMVFHHGVGCEQCAGTGYKGRVGIYELFVMSEDMQELVLQKAPANVLHAKARELGMQTMAEDGFQKALAGFTTVTEVVRVAPLDQPLKKLSDIPHDEMHIIKELAIEDGASDAAQVEKESVDASAA